MTAVAAYRSNSAAFRVDTLPGDDDNVWNSPDLTTQTSPTPIYDSAFPKLDPVGSSGFSSIGDLRTAMGTYSVRNLIRDLADGKGPRVPQVIAHRGLMDPGRGIQENTISAVHNGWLKGIANFELDVRTSSDGVPFLMHDNTVGRNTTLPNRPLSDFDSATLANADVVIRDPRTNATYRTGDKVPSLEKVLDHARTHFPGASFFIDAKDRTAASVIALLNRRPEFKENVAIKFYSVGMPRGVDELKAALVLEGHAKSLPEAAEMLKGIKIVPGANDNWDEYDPKFARQPDQPESVPGVPPAILDRAYKAYNWAKSFIDAGMDPISIQTERTSTVPKPEQSLAAHWLTNEFRLLQTEYNRFADFEVNGKPFYYDLNGLAFDATETIRQNPDLKDRNTVGGVQSDLLTTDRPLETVAMRIGRPLSGSSAATYGHPGLDLEKLPNTPYDVDQRLWSPRMPSQDGQYGLMKWLMGIVRRDG